MRAYMKTMKEAKSLIIAILLLAVSGFANAQVQDPVQWDTDIQKIANDEYVLIAKAQIEDGWHLYAQEVPEDGPIPTQFSFDEDMPMTLKGSVEEENGKVVQDDVFGMEIKLFEEKAVFKQKIKLEGKGSKIEASVRYMVCNNINCLPPKTVDLVFNFE